MRKLGIGLIAVFLPLFNINVCAQQARVLAPHKPVTPKIDAPRPSPRAATLRSLVGGFWMVGPDLKATIHLSNDVATNPIPVTPILHLSSGRAMALPPVQLAPSGMAVVSIDEGLAQAAVDHTKPLYGYLEVQYTWPWDAICASVKDIDTAHSLIFIHTLEPLQKPKMHTPIPTVALMQDNVLEGFWWKQEPGVTGFVAISNVLAAPANANIVVSDEANIPIASHKVSVLGHGTVVVNLTELDSAPGPQGGIHITYDGPTDGLEINGGLEDPATGFSAHLPLHFPPIVAAQHAGLSYAALDLMNGAADPNMSFPAGTTFTPYAVARNISNQPLTVTPTLWWMVGIVPHSARLSSVTIAPHQTVNLNAPALLESAGLKDFVGSFNLEIEADGQSRALLEATGSVDQTNNYVFEVSPMGTMESVAKALSYWSTGNGDNTMITLWNPADEPQSLKFVLYFAGGDSQYTVPIYLNGRETRSFNISTIINSSAPDPDGNVIPPGTHEGRAEVMGANGENEHILVAMSEGVYNVQKATCGNNYCQTCQGAVDAWILANPFSVASGGSTGLTFTVQYKSGTQYNHTSIATWTSSNTSIATVSAGSVRGASPGAVSMVADDSNVPDYSYMCYSSNPDSTCPTYTGASASGGGDVAKLSCTAVTRGQTTTCTATGASGATFSNWKFADSNGHTVTTSATQSQWSGIAVQSGTVSVTVSTTDTGQQVVSAPLTVTARSNWSLSPKSSTRRSSPYTCENGQPLSVPTTPSNGSPIGQSCPDPHFSYQGTVISSGPNSGFDYVNSVNDIGEYSWVISGDIDNSGSQFYQAQCGNYNPSTNPNGYISGSTLDADDQRHEGGSVNSHYAEYSTAYQNSANNPGSVMESFVEYQPSSFDSDVKNKLGQLQTAIFNATTPEPCGNSYAGYSASCVFDGYMNFAPYVSCH
jgi:hypothetical protein